MEEKQELTWTGLFTSISDTVLRKLTSRKLWVALVSGLVAYQSGNYELLGAIAGGYIGVEGVGDIVQRFGESRARKEAPVTPAPIIVERYVSTPAPPPEAVPQWTPPITWQPSNWANISKGILASVRADANVQYKAFVAYDLFRYQMGMYDEYDNAPPEVRVEDALKAHAVALPLAQAAYEEIVGLQAPKSLTAIGNHRDYLMQVKKAIEAKTGTCAGNLDGRFRVQIGDMQEIYEHIDGLKAMEKKGWDATLLSSQGNNAWGLGGLSDALVYEA